MAHSLGYPHPDLMLSQMTAVQYQELLIYCGMKAERRERAQIVSEESDIRNFFSRKISQQKRDEQSIR